MKDLIKFELYKIFSRKIVLVLMLVCVITPILPAISDYVDIKEKGLISYENVKNICKEYEGQVLTYKNQEGLENNYQKIIKKYNSGEKTTDIERAITIIRNDYLIGTNRIYIKDDRIYEFNDIKKELNRLETEGHSNSYEYKELKYVYDLLSKKETPKYYFKFGWRYATDFDMLPIFISILILVSICTIFSNEYQSNTASIVLSSKNGQKKLTVAKIITGLIFSTLVFLLINGIQVILLAMHGFNSWDVPMSFLSPYVRGPYNMNIGIFYICGLIVSFIGFMLFTLLVILISLISKNNMLSFAASIAMLLGPEFLGKIMPTNTLVKIFTELNIESLISPIKMFENISIYNIFGNPVLYLNVIVTIAIISIPIVLYFIRKLDKKQVV